MNCATYCEIPSHNKLIPSIKLDDFSQKCIAELVIKSNNSNRYFSALRYLKNEMEGIRPQKSINKSSLKFLKFTMCTLSCFYVCSCHSKQSQSVNQLTKN